MSAKKRLKQNSLVGDWRLGKFLGAGGQGEVWEVRPTKSHHSPPRAMKCSFTNEETARDRFRREVELLRSISHPNVIGVYGDDLSWEPMSPDGEQFAYYVTELCIGALPDIPRLRQDPALCLELFRQACTAVAFLHGRPEPIIHRDIKPSNFLLASEPFRLVVADLGIARRVDIDPKLTKTHEVVGSPHYRAPETHYGDAGLPRIDVYSLGRVLEWLFVEREPDSLFSQPIPRGRLLSDALCESLDRVIGKACLVDPELRIQDVASLVSLLPRVHIDLLPELQLESSAPSVPSEVYESVSSAVRQRDDVLVRRLVRDVRHLWFEPLVRLRARRESTVLDRADLLDIAIETLNIAAPTLAAMLAVHEARRPELFPFSILLSDLCDNPKWKPSGLTVLVDLPRLIAFCSHWLLGAAQIASGDMRTALAALDRPVRRKDGSGDSPLCLQHDLTGWPESLEGDLMKSWNFLKSVPDHQPWLLKLFASREDYETGLRAYSLLAIMSELVDLIRAGNHNALLVEGAGVRLDVPPFAWFDGPDALMRAWRSVFAYVSFDQLMAQLSVAPEVFRHLWPRWINLAIAPFGTLRPLYFSRVELQLPP